MTSVDYRQCRDAALNKALAASNAKVRLAYIDLASFYDLCTRKQLQSYGDVSNLSPQ